MPITKSAEKQMYQSRVRHARRQPYKTHMKTMIKKLADTVKSGKRDEALKLLPVVYKAIDTAAKKHIIHPKNADRKKASAAKLVAVKK